MASRAFPWKLVSFVSGLLVIGGLIGAYLVAMRGAVQAFYQAEYQPEPLPSSLLGMPPASARVATVPWHSEKLGVVSSTCLRMLAAQQGASIPRATADFLLGSTWGASPIPRRTGFFPGQDVEAGFLLAAPYLGFTRRYLTTDSGDEDRKSVV